MNVIIFGATGTIGQQLVQQALEDGHHVTAFARRPEALEARHERLTLHAGDAMDASAVLDAVKGHDGVMIALGSPKLTGKVRSQGTKNIVDAMTQHGIKRLVCQTTLGVGSSHQNLNFYWKYPMFGMLLRAVYNDHVQQEEIIHASDLDWVIARPAAFVDGPITGQYKHGFGGTEKDLTLKISRADVAQFMLGQLTDDIYLRQTPGLSY